MSDYASYVSVWRQDRRLAGERYQPIYPDVILKYDTNRQLYESTTR